VKRASQIVASSSLGYLQLAALTRDLTHLLSDPEVGRVLQLCGVPARFRFGLLRTCSGGMEALSSSVGAGGPCILITDVVT
jgi:hypothetical protein